MDILSALLDNSGQGQAASLNAQDSTQQTRNAYQKGVDSTLKKLGEAHAAEAVQQGISPMDIANHPMMSDQQQQDPHKLLSSLIATAAVPKTQGDNTGAAQSNPVLDFFAKLGITNTPENQVLMTQTALNKQKLAAGNPAETALPAAQATGLLQEQAGQKPIQPEQQAQFLAGQNTAQLNAMNDTIQRLQARRDALNTEFEQEGKSISLMGKLGGLLTFQGQQMTPRMKAIRTEQQGIDRVSAKIQSKLANFTPTNVAALKGGVPPAPQGATHYSPSTGKFYDAQGNPINATSK